MSKQTYKPTELEVKYLQALGYTNPTKINASLRKIISILNENKFTPVIVKYIMKGRKYGNMSHEERNNLMIEFDNTNPNLIMNEINKQNNKILSCTK